MSDVPKRPMSAAEKDMALELAGCRFLPGSWDKRFAQDMAARAITPGNEITEKQAEWLETMAHRYRRQLKRQT